tara:strand:- start:89 stop:274 length:186 start_codon:yes stop_codon:yes gene_type:complete
MLSTKITYELAEWIREWIKSRNQSPSTENCFKFVEWKSKINELSESDKLQIEAILIYETSQ